MNNMKRIKWVLIASLTLMACKKDVNSNSQIVLGDDVVFAPKIYPQTVTQDINDNYLFGDSVYIPRPAKLVKIALNVQNKGGYTTKCKLIVNQTEIRTIGRPVYRGIGDDSTFTFYDTVSLPKGWNFIKFTGFSWAPAIIYYRIYEGDVRIIDDSTHDIKIVGLPLTRQRKFN